MKTNKPELIFVAVYFLGFWVTGGYAVAVQDDHIASLCAGILWPIVVPISIFAELFTMAGVN